MSSSSTTDDVQTSPPAAKKRRLAPEADNSDNGTDSVAAAHCSHQNSTVAPATTVSTSNWFFLQV